MDGILTEGILMAGEKVKGLLDGVGEMFENWGAPVLFLVGALLVIVGIVKIAKGLMSHGQGQVNWVLNIGCLLIGGLLIAASTSMFNRIKDAGTILDEDLGDLLGEGKGGAIVLNID